MKADLHIHSYHSIDSISKPESILEMASERGIDIIAIADYNSTSAWKEFQNLQQKYPVQVIWGQEIKLLNGKYNDGELLALFLQKPIKSKITVDIIKEVNKQGGLVSIAHPFCERRGEFRAFDQIDNWKDLAIEVRNGRTYKKRDNEMAEGLSERLQTPKTAGSDAHTPFEVGNVYLEFDGKNSMHLKKAIINREVKVGGEPSSTLFTFLSNFGRFGITA